MSLLRQFSKSRKQNKYGGYSYLIELNRNYHIEVHGSSNKSFIVEFKEANWINYKTQFTYISNENLEETICEAFLRMVSYFETRKDYLGTAENWDLKLIEVLEVIEKHNL